MWSNFLNPPISRAAARWTRLNFSIRTPSRPALPLLGFSPQIWGFPTRSRVLGFFLGDLGFFLGFLKKSRVFLGFCQISPKNTYFEVFFAGKQVVFGEKVWNELLILSFWSVKGKKFI